MEPRSLVRRTVRVAGFPTGRLASRPRIPAGIERAGVSLAETTKPRLRRRKAPTGTREVDMDSAEVTALIHRAAEGDQAAWNAIVDEYAGLVRSVVRGFRLGDAQSADAVQTTWLRLIEHVTVIREPE